jgi:hypothetical protein
MPAGLLLVPVAPHAAGVSCIHMRWGAGGTESEPVNGILHSLASGTKAVDRMESEDGMKVGCTIGAFRWSLLQVRTFHIRSVSHPATHTRADRAPAHGWIRCPEHELIRRRTVRGLGRTPGCGIHIYYHSSPARFLPHRPGCASFSCSALISPGRHLSGALSSTPPPPSAPPVHHPDHCLRRLCARGRCATDELQRSWIAHRLDSRYLHFRSPSSMHPAGSPCRHCGVSPFYPAPIPFA